MDLERLPQELVALILSKVDPKHNLNLLALLYPLALEHQGNGHGIWSNQASIDLQRDLVTSSMDIGRRFARFLHRWSRGGLPRLTLRMRLATDLHATRFVLFLRGWLQVLAHTASLSHEERVATAQPLFRGDTVGLRAYLRSEPPFTLSPMSLHHATSIHLILEDKHPHAPGQLVPLLTAPTTPTLLAALGIQSVSYRVRARDLRFDLSQLLAIPRLSSLTLLDMHGLYWLPHAPCTSLSSIKMDLIDLHDVDRLASFPHLQHLVIAAPWRRTMSRTLSAAEGGNLGDVVPSWAQSLRHLPRSLRRLVLIDTESFGWSTSPFWTMDDCRDMKNWGGEAGEASPSSSSSSCPPLPRSFFALAKALEHFHLSQFVMVGFSLDANQFRAALSPSISSVYIARDPSSPPLAPLTPRFAL